MREIKFQAYLHHEKQMVQVVEINFTEKWIGYFDTEGMNDAEAFELIRSGSPNADCPFERCDLRQYTGLKDKNGKEIYEGDIIQFKNYGTTGSHWYWVRDENGREKLGGDIRGEGYTSTRIVEFIDGSFWIGICYLHELSQRDGTIYDLHRVEEGYMSKTKTTYGEFEIIGNEYEHPHLIGGESDGN